LFSDHPFEKRPVTTILDSDFHPVTVSGLIFSGMSCKQPILKKERIHKFTNKQDQMLKSICIPCWKVLLSETMLLMPNPNEIVAKSSNPHKALLDNKATFDLLSTLALIVTPFSGKDF